MTGVQNPARLMKIIVNMSEMPQDRRSLIGWVNVRLEKIIDPEPSQNQIQILCNIESHHRTSID